MSSLPDPIIVELHLRRLRKGLSAEALGRAAGVAGATVRHAEQGLNSPSLWTVGRLCRALGVQLVLAEPDRAAAPPRARPPAITPEQAAHNRDVLMGRA